MVSLLRAEALAFDYPGPEHALRGVDIALERGELAVAIGPNGSGKSTLLGCLAGLFRPTRGRVLWQERPLAELRPRERARRIAVVPQFLPALPEVRVRDFVLGGRYAHSRRFGSASAEDQRVVAQALESCDAVEIAARAMTELSGGQRQRVLIARALAQEAEVLLVDEPTSSLDPEHQVRVLELLAQATRAGKTALVATHDLALATQFATRVHLLHRGLTAASGSVRDVLRREVLAPVYGTRLYYGELPNALPLVLPWMEAR
jgi:iron complex transport system ATP-binding protein